MPVDERSAQGRNATKLGFRTIFAGFAVAPILAAAATPAVASADKPVIALSNAYYGNTWRHQMVEAFEAAAKEPRPRARLPIISC